MQTLVAHRVRREVPVVEGSLHFLGTTDLTGDVERVARWICRMACGQRLPVFYLGCQPYRPVWELQKRLHAWRVSGQIPDLALLLEHEPVYTLGKNADGANLLARRPAAAEVVATDRGGDVTYHGPGQLVGYPIVDLRQHRCSVTWYLRGLEEVIIRTLAALGLKGARMDGYPGVWFRQRKVAALGVRLARWTTMHGFALNVCVPRRYLEGMIPCGIRDYGVANINDFLRVPADVLGLAWRLAPRLQDFFGQESGPTA